jgi:hypothetical protein
MRPALVLERGTLADGIARDARGYGRAICQVESEAAGRIDRLVKRMRSQLGVSASHLPRAAMLRALIVRGLEGAEPQGLLISSTFKHARFAARFELVLTEIEIDRVDRFRAARWSRSTQPPVERLLGALVRRALPLAELEPSFAQEALTSRLPPREATS